MSKHDFYSIHGPAFGVRGTTIKVASGHYVDLINPDPGTLDLHSIAWALSQLCRFGGHSPRFYSVAEHCVLASELAELDERHVALQRALLLHDATEAYLGDVVKPLKIMLLDYEPIEQRMEAAIAQRFEVDLQGEHGLIKHYDRQMLVTEKARLWPDDTESWLGFEHVKPANVTLYYDDPQQAYLRFMGRAHFLGLAPPEHLWQPPRSFTEIRP